jgi:signal transduction histidine kinase
MAINKTRSWVYILSSVWVVLLLGIGSWWLYLTINLVGADARFVNMMKWEGGFFIGALVLLGLSLFGMYMRDLRRSKAMQAFFSSLSHELKTPLASMKLQAEVIKDMIEDESHSHDQLSALTGRLIQDTHKLESELEKALQLSRIEQDAPLSLGPFSLERYLKSYQKKLPVQLELKLDPDALEVMADEFAVNMIFRNLFENTFRHRPTSAMIEISSRRLLDRVEIVYDDHGKRFAGDLTKLGEIFYKHNSSQGSGIGLYLIRHLMRKMNGQLSIDNSERLKFILSFKATHG